MPADLTLDPAATPSRAVPGVDGPSATSVRAWPSFTRTAMPAALLAAIAVALAVVVGVRPVSDPSPWLHLKVGAFLLDGGRFALPDPWAPLAAKEYLPTQWLPEVAGQEIYAAFGLPGIAWMRCAGILGLLTALVWSARRSAGSATAVLVAAAAVLGAYEGLTERPQLVGFALLAVAVGAWWRTALDLRPRWWLVPMTWLWACCHGLWSVGVAVALVVIAGLVLDRRVTRTSGTKLLAVPILSVVVAGLTPLGPRLLLSPLTVGGNVSDFVGEWQPTSARDPYAVVTLVMLGLVVLAWVRSGVRPPWWQIGLLVTGFAATLAMTRTIAVGAVIAAPLLANEIQLRRGRTDAPTAGSRWTWAALVAAALLVAVPLSAARAQDAALVPDLLRPQLSLIPSGTVVLADGDVNGWLFWADPGIVPVLDPRIEIYTASHVRAFVATMAAAPGWREFVDKSGARYALVQAGSPIATALVERAHWSTVGKDAGFALLKAS